MKKGLLQKRSIAIIGTTASGKTSLGVRLAYKFNGEIVSADSRQVFRGMDVGTGKDLGEYAIQVKKNKKDKKVKIPYHLIDIVSPKTEFNLAKYQKLAHKAIDDILARGRWPIIVGGTGLYAQALVDGYSLSEVRPNKLLRSRLEKKTAEQLLLKLKKLAPRIAEKINQSDKNNKRRLIRYIEIYKSSLTAHKAIKPLKEKPFKGYDVLLIGLTQPREELKKRIYQRLIKRLEQEDMVGEVKKLHSQGVSWHRLESFGLEYKFVALYLQNKLSYDEMVEKLNIAIRQLAKRQMTWLRRWQKQGAKIRWVKSRGEAEKLVKYFIAKQLEMVRKK